ncbi:YfhO family protein [Hallella multisaccharivorax]|uniref:YfhO family protein n=1 Tax=Hallella multisaccharivorax TaxID=310514 RepID=UPI00361B2E8F
MKTLKKCLPDILAVILFIVLSVAYFAPADFEGRILFQHDSAAGIGAGREAQQYHEKTGKTTRWTNALFGGMPTYQTAPSYSSNTILNKAISFYHLWLPDYVWFLFAYLLGFYILLRAFDFKQYLAVLGSIIWAFSSYFLIIIAAGHLWKVMALAYLPPMIGGMVLAYRGKYLWGFTVTAIFTAFEINANHVQMTYYYLFIILFLVIAWLVAAIRQHWLPRFWKASGVVAAAAIIGICINLPNLYHTWQYQKESMRGKSELVKKNTTEQTSSGLDRDYITQWSYGIDETWTLLVPNVKGGASVPMAANTKAMKKADPQYMQAYQQLGQYWGDQPGTSGPVYVGAFVLLLFFLGLFIVKGPVKWALLAATVLSILLSWGHNFMGFTNFFIDYVPLYAKFRTVASILVIAEFTIPLLAMMALKKIIDEPDTLKRNKKWLWTSFGLTGGVSLLFWLAPTLFFPNYISAAEMQQFGQIAQQGAEASQFISGLEANLTTVREYIFTSDALRSFIIIAIGMALLLLFYLKKLNAKFTVVCIALLCLVDMWQVDKRYLNDAMFVERSVRDTPQPMTETDKLILRDKGLDYRVLNLASNTFNENETSYYHKSIGGYHAAKLRRYQEMIDAYIVPEMQKMMPAIAKAEGDMTKVNGDSIFPVLDMLNAKYFIFPLQNNRTVPLQNPYVNGNAWFVDKVYYAANANEEIAKVGQINLKHEAVADRQFESTLGKAIRQDGESMVTLKDYEPNHLIYEVNSAKGGVLVFSEIYYPGWTATIDGKSAELGRANYILRALRVVPGKHEIVLDFHPASIRNTEAVAYGAYLLLFVLIIAGIYTEWKKKKKQQ